MNKVEVKQDEQKEKIALCSKFKFRRPVVDIHEQPSDLPSLVPEIQRSATPRSPSPEQSGSKRFTKRGPVLLGDGPEKPPHRGPHAAHGRPDPWRGNQRMPHGRPNDNFLPNNFQKRRMNDYPYNRNFSNNRNDRRMGNFQGPPGNDRQRGPGAFHRGVGNLNQRGFFEPNARNNFGGNVGSWKCNDSSANLSRLWIFNPEEKDKIL